ncbi:GNAT family N-acetyltransferase [Halorhabdus salina]|uniref:GNAT family N-acetyltransferase n=1 Tax=Halorhabdus salina TaxID=2750670 RepID=UPI0015EE39D2|nr:GNAT family N-acetyltransferase [Halorhabdus salina]
MEIRTAREADKPAIRDVARRSLQASYSLRPQTITSGIEEWYNEAQLTKSVTSDERMLLVADRDGQIVGFSESTLTADRPWVTDKEDRGRDALLLWLHIDPEYRGEGIGSALFETTLDRLDAADAASVQGRVLANNQDGTQFFESHGFERVGRTEIDIGGRSHVEYRYVAEATGLEPLESGEQTVYVDHDESEGGSEAPFHIVYSDPDRSARYGYYCDNCGRLANAMDAMGRIECEACGNTRKPTRWDAAYL